jgi:hypothetical protein
LFRGDLSYNRAKSCLKSFHGALAVLCLQIQKPLSWEPVMI